MEFNEILDLDLDLAFEITRDFRLNNFDRYLHLEKHDIPQTAVHLVAGVMFSMSLLSTGVGVDLLQSLETHCHTLTTASGREFSPKLE